MKIIYLNIWHGTQKQQVTEFINEHSPSTDVFCFQESDVLTREFLRDLLPNFTEYAATKPKGSLIGGHDIDVATYVHSTLPVSNVKTLLETVVNTGLSIVTDVEVDGKIISIANVHGIALPGDTKLDTPERLVQSQTVIDAVKDSQTAIIGGDFNLLPRAKSVTMFAEAGYQDLIAAYEITTTRNRLVWEKYPDNIQYHADYTFATQNIAVQSFDVPVNEVSDHLPMIIELSF